MTLGVENMGKSFGMKMMKHIVAIDDSRTMYYDRYIVYSYIIVSTLLHIRKDALRRYPSKMKTEHVPCFLMLQPC